MPFPRCLLAGLRVLLPLTVLVALLPVVAAGQSAAPLTLPLKALGHEPGWTLDIASDGMTLVTDYGRTRIALPPASPVDVPGGRRFDARSEVHAVQALVLDRVCADAMTGMPRPYSVELTVDGTRLKGCAGDPAVLLRGDWVVTRLSGAAPLPKAPITMSFASNGRLQGSTSCNLYSSSYVIGGAGVTVTLPISTMRGCAAASRAQEGVFLELLRGVERFEVTGEDALVLHTAGGGTIAASRAGRATRP